MHVHKNHSMKRAGEAGSQRRAVGVRMASASPLPPRANVAAAAL